MTTISTQRGAVVASSFTTLFTNSSSVNATRVITNGVNISNYGYTYPYNIGGTLVVCPSGGIGYNIGIAGSAGYACPSYAYNCTTYGIQLYHDPRIMPGMWHNGTSVPPQPAIQTNSGSTYCMFMPTSYTGQNPCCAAGCPVLGSSNYACAVYNPTCLCCATYQVFGSTVPQFWLGASDAVKFNSRGCSFSGTFCFVGQGKGGYVYMNTCYAVYVGYSFTLVSE